MDTINTSEFVNTFLSELKEEPPSGIFDLLCETINLCFLTILFEQLDEMTEKTPLSSDYLKNYLKDLQSRLPEHTIVCCYEYVTGIPIPKEFESVATETPNFTDTYHYKETSFPVCHFFTHLINMFENTELTAKHVDELCCRYTDLYIRTIE
ncbi:MAG: hypothetical protein Homavirus6_8 [Homavirus sp.]|uniref:Uncharacterized protein n=1 Tax=Homavirus sp. TaxID=2487769 RepID=A0A3G5A4F1_9VIRU|nr:MAG: hypothetical protein Homavirus6_8 [Homavirus sp.]